MMIIDKKTGKVEVEHGLAAESLTDQKTVDRQFRRIRMTARGTYLAPFLKMNKVVEYDKHFRAIWTYEIPTPWAAVRLHNGDTLITDEHDKLVREVSPKYETVWEFKQSDLPADARCCTTYRPRSACQRQHRHLQLNGQGANARIGRASSRLWR